MAALDDLISQIPDESLRERIRAEMKRANRQKKFGLVFEEHLPETISIERSNVGEAYTDHLFVDNATGKTVIKLNNWEKAAL